MSEQTGVSVEVLPASETAIQPFKVAATEVERRAAAIVIQSPEDYAQAGEFGVTIQTQIRAFEEKFEPTVAAALKAHREATSLRNSVVDPLKKAKTIIADKMSGWNREQREKARREEAERIAAQRKAEEEARLASAITMEAAGFPEMAEEVLDRPVAVTPVIPVVSAPKVAGTVGKVSWTYRVIDEALIDRKFLKIDEAKIKALVKAIGPEAVAQIGGIQVFEDDSVSFRREKA